LCSKWGGFDRQSAEFQRPEYPLVARFFSALLSSQAVFSHLLFRGTDEHHPTLQFAFVTSRGYELQLLDCSTE